jgi:hypothetical protein
MLVEEMIDRRFNELDMWMEALERKIAPAKGGKLVHVNDPELMREWGTSVLSFFHNMFGEKSVYYRSFEDRYRLCGSAAFDFRECKGVFTAAYKDFLGGYIFNIQSQILVDVVADELEMAELLLNQGNKDIACAVSRIGLEIALKKLCDINGIPYDRTTKIEALNTSLKEKGVYNLGNQKQVTAWLDKGNAACHGRYTEYEAAQVKIMIDGIRDFIVRYL